MGGGGLDLSTVTLYAMSTSSTPNAVSASGIVKKFLSGSDRITALDSLDFDMKQGEFVAIMGASGSGKSTLLHILAGLVLPDDGRLQIGDKNPATLSDKELTLFRRDHIGLVFQAFNLLPTLSVEENILLPILAGCKNIPTPERVSEIIESVGLTHRRHQRADALSGGEQQRVAIARALITEPTLLLADEPTGNLDSINGKKICDILTHLHSKEGRSLLVVTHEPSVALRAERIIILKDGKLIADEPSARFSTTLELAQFYQSLVDISVVAE